MSPEMISARAGKTAIACDLCKQTFGFFVEQVIVASVIVEVCCPAHRSENVYGAFRLDPRADNGGTHALDENIADPGWGKFWNLSGVAGVCAGYPSLSLAYGAIPLPSVARSDIGINGGPTSRAPQ